LLSTISVEPPVVLPGAIGRSADTPGRSDADPITMLFTDADAPPGDDLPRLIESSTLLQTLTSVAPFAFAFLDPELRLTRINDALARAHGLSVQDSIGRYAGDVLPDRWAEVEPLYRQVLATGLPVLDQRSETDDPAQADGVLHWLWSLYPVHIDDALVGVGVMGIDITTRVEADDLREVVTEHMAEGLYVLDAAGHVTFVNRAASRMLGWTEDELRHRPMHQTIHFQRADGTPCAEDACELLQVRTEGRTVRTAEDAFTRRDGSIFPVAYSVTPLIRGGSPRGVVVVFRDITEEAAERARIRREVEALTWVGRIRDALAEDRLVLHAQPIVSLAGGELGEELLVRMIDRDGELIPPCSFLPVAERYGLIGDIDRWVVVQGIRRAAAGHRVSINLSTESIMAVDLVALIAGEFQATGARPQDVVFEITETALMKDMEAAEVFARAIAAIGCGLALDDFGTGYGSFTYLTCLRVTHLKIDIAFVRGMTQNPAHQHLVRAIVNIADGFDLKTVAEGVEDEATLDMLRDFGVDFAQGYHLGRPAPIG
jgi:PAS domain S-box-containing protein